MRHVLARPKLAARQLWVSAPFGCRVSLPRCPVRHDWSTLLYQSAGLKKEDAVMILDELVDRSYGAALLLASIYARVSDIESRGEKPPACWEDARGCVRGLLACGLADAAAGAPVASGTAAGLMERLCAIAEDCGVNEPASFFS